MGKRDWAAAGSRLEKPLPPAPSAVRQELLTELDLAIGDHLAWLKVWHRVLICDDPAEASDLIYDPGDLCRFGAWYLRHQNLPLIDQPALRKLAAEHHEMHERARLLAARGNAKEPIARAEYDDFMERVESFIAQCRRLEKAFAAAASDLDPLTGLHNRQAMLNDLDRERARFLRTKRPCCLAMGDIDHFKRVNDGYGHAAGDIVLAAAAESFLAHLRPSDSLYRWGGEEFLFCLPDTDEEAGAKVLDRLRAGLEAADIALPDGRRLKVTCSFGIAAMNRETNVEETKEWADVALYAAKEGGRNRVRTWSATRPPESAPGAKKAK